MAIMLGDTKINIIKGTTLLDALKDYMEYREWDDELQSNDDDTAQILASSYEIDDQNYNFYLECHQNLDTFRCYFYSPFKINTQKYDAVCNIINFANMRLLVGRFAMSRPAEGESNSIQYYSSLDVEGSNLSTKMIGNLMDYATGAFSNYAPLMAAVALTKISAAQAIEDFLAEEAGAEGEEEAAPDEL